MSRKLSFTQIMAFLNEVKGFNQHQTRAPSACILDKLVLVLCFHFFNLWRFFFVSIYAKYVVQKNLLGVFCKCKMALRDSVRWYGSSSLLYSYVYILWVCRKSRVSSYALPCRAQLFIVSYSAFSLCPSLSLSFVFCGIQLCHNFFFGFDPVLCCTFESVCWWQICDFCLKVVLFLELSLVL